MSVTWEDPPAPSARRGGPAWVQQLKNNPGKWAHVETKTSRERANGFAGNVKFGKATCYQPAGSFEAVFRTVDGEFRVYARYVGETEA